jgi:ubiquinone biosynthesis protein Coq4
MKEMMNGIKDEIKEDTSANRKTNREDMKQEVRAGQKHMQEMIRASQEKMEAIIQSIWSERDETHVKNIMTHVKHKTQSLQKACQEMTTCHKRRRHIQRRFSPIQE